MERSYIDEGEVPLFHLIPALFRMMDFGKIKKKYGLTKSQLILMVALQRHDSLSMSEIAEYISSSKEQSTRAVASLAERELIRRFELAENRKLVHISLTEQGVSMMNAIRSELCSMLRERISAALNEEEMHLLEASAATALRLLSKVCV